jgi:hypothetical protein
MEGKLSGRNADSGKCREFMDQGIGLKDAAGSARWPGVV